MFIKIIKMLYYERIDISEGIHVNKTSASKECNICHYLKNKCVFQNSKISRKCKIKGFGMS